MTSKAYKNNPPPPFRNGMGVQFMGSLFGGAVNGNSFNYEGEATREDSLLSRLCGGYEVNEASGWWPQGESWGAKTIAGSCQRDEALQRFFLLDQERYLRLL